MAHAIIFIFFKEFEEGLMKMSTNLESDVFKTLDEALDLGQTTSDVSRTTNVQYLF